MTEKKLCAAVGAWLAWLKNCMMRREPNQGLHLRQMFRSLVVALLASLLYGCATPLPPEPCIIQQVLPPPTPQLVCEPEIDLATEAALRKLSLGNEWHRERRYEAAFEAYEAVLAEHASLLADAYALWGIIALRLDRDNPGYSRDAAQTVTYVLDQRVADAVEGEAAAEARLLWFSAKVMLEADISKDKVVEDNQRLRKELEQRDEAIARLRELTVGRN